HRLRITVDAPVLPELEGRLLRHGLENMFGSNEQGAQLAEEWTEWFFRREPHGQIVHFLDGGILILHHNGIAQARIAEAVLYDRAERKDHIVGCERMPVRPFESLAQNESICALVGADCE